MKYWRVLKLPFQNKNETFEMLIIKQRGNDKRGQRLTSFCERVSPLKNNLRYHFATTSANTVFVFIFFFHLSFKHVDKPFFRGDVR